MILREFVREACFWEYIVYYAKEMITYSFKKLKNILQLCSEDFITEYFQKEQFLYLEQIKSYRHCKKMNDL